MVFSPIVSTFIISSGTAIATKYAVDCAGNIIYKKTTTVISKKVSDTYNYFTETEEDIDAFYEYVDIDKDDEIVYVVSKKRSESIDENWTRTSSDSLKDLQDQKDKDLQDQKDKDFQDQKDLEKGKDQKDLQEERDTIFAI